MRTKFFGPLLSLSLAATSLPLVGCDSVFSGWLRYGDNPGGDGGTNPLEDLAGADLTGADLSETGDMAMGLVDCPQWSPGTTGMEVEPWLTEYQVATADAGTTWERVAVLDFDGNGLMDIGVAELDSNNNASITIILQTAPCTFSPSRIKMTTTVSLPNRMDGQWDFAAFPTGTNNRWDAALLGFNRRLAWCSNSYGGMRRCVDADVAALYSNIGERKIVVNDTGRVDGDYVVIQQKSGNGSPDLLLRVERSAMAFTTTPVYSMTDEDPNYAVVVQYGGRTTAVSLIKKLVPAGMNRMQTSTFAAGTYSKTIELASSIDSFNAYLYAGRFTNDEFDDVLVLSKANTGGMQLYQLTMMGTASFASIGTPASLAYKRDLTMARDLDGDGIDELIVAVPSANSTVFRYFKRPGGTGNISLGGSGPTIPRGISSYTFARFQAQQPRPDLVYVSTAAGTSSLYLRRANTRFTP